MTDLPTIRPMTDTDVEPASAVIASTGWGDRRSWFEFAVASRSVHPFVAVDPDGSIAGTGVAAINGRVAWIGTIWVHPDRRGQGLGRRLTEIPIDAAERARCRTLVLVATDAGRRLYERLGFRIQTHYRIIEAPGIDSAEVTPHAEAITEVAPPSDPGRLVRPWRPDDLATAAALDAQVTGEDRRHLLEAFARPATARVVTDAHDRLRGFVVRAPWGGGATIAPDPEDALALLHARRIAAGPGGRVRAGLLADNERGLTRLATNGWVDIWQAPRMIRGAPLEWHPDGIWGQYNHAVG
jgi:ribosomal protein S18 acetylase RimI-like enzyme